MMFSLIFGKLKVSGEASDILKISSLMIKNNFSLYGLYTFDKSGCFFSPLYERKNIEELCKRLNVNVEINVFGFPKILELYKKRTGIFVGLAICISLIFISKNYIWTMNITGNDSISNEQITEFLKSEGIYVGAKNKGHELKTIAIDAELKFENLAWMAINLQGTTANVEIRERKTKPSETDMSVCTNIVASCDGQIVYARASSGNLAVKKYDVVTKGQLLIGGILDSKAYGYKTVRAVGEILAKTEHTYCATVSKKQNKKVYSGRENSAVTFEIFSKSLSLGKNKFELFDTTYTENKVTLFSSVTLPITVKRKIYREFSYVSEKISTSDAIMLARQQIGDDIAAELSDAEITEKTENVTENSDSVTVEITVKAIENICSEALALH